MPIGTHRAGDPVNATCRLCGIRFTYGTKGGRPRSYCSEACKTEGGARQLIAARCRTCDAEYFPRYATAGYCSLVCRRNPERRVWANKADARAHARHTRRARRLGEGFERFDRREIYERDGWICGICAEPVDPALKYPDLMSASLDHVTPLALGGQHNRANVQCAHFICNSRKAHRGNPCREVA